MRAKRCHSPPTGISTGFWLNPKLESTKQPKKTGALSSEYQAHPRSPDRKKRRVMTSMAAGRAVKTGVENS